MQDTSESAQDFEARMCSKKIQVRPVDLLLEPDIVNDFHFSCTFEAGSSNVSTQATIPGQKCVATETSLPDQSHGEPVDFLAFNREQFKAVTGIEKSLLFVIIDALEIVGSKLKDSLKLSKVQKVLLCLVKLKLNLTFTSLGALFCVSRVSAAAWFDCTLKELTNVARLGVVWFDRATVQARMPTSFKALFPKTRCIIDCSEVYCEKPKSQKKHVLLYSHYKSHCTMKFLVACAPSGEIVFLSHAFGGRSTDAQITVKSGFLNLIERGDLIMADKGFPKIEESNNLIFLFPKQSFD